MFLDKFSHRYTVTISRTLEAAFFIAAYLGGLLIGLYTRMFLHKNNLIVQIRTFAKYHPRNVYVGDDDEEGLLQFAKFTGKNDVSEINVHDVSSYCEWLRQHATPYQVQNQATTIRCLLRYYNFHRNMPKTRVGHPPKVEEIKKVKQLVDEGRSYRDVQEITGLHLSHIHKWVHYKLPKRGSAKP